MTSSDILLLFFRFSERMRLLKWAILGLIHKQTRNKKEIPPPSIHLTKKEDGYVKWITLYFSK